MMSVLQSKVNALVMLRLSGLKVNKNAMFSPILLFTSIYKKINKFKNLKKKKACS